MSEKKKWLVMSWGLLWSVGVFGGVSIRAQEAQKAQGNPLENMENADSLYHYFNRREIRIGFSFGDTPIQGLKNITLWVTRDEGATWEKAVGAALQKLKGSQPVFVYKVPGEGRYGFQISYEQAFFGAMNVPASGDYPQLLAVVDTQPPHINLFKMDETASGKIHVVWSAEDASLGEKPVRLEYSVGKKGAWQVWQKSLPRLGEQELGWPAGTTAGSLVRGRLTAIDLAGNQSEKIVELVLVGRSLAVNSQQPAVNSQQPAVNSRPSTLNPEINKIRHEIEKREKLPVVVESYFVDLLPKMYHTLQRVDGNLDHVRENTHQTLQETQALNAKMEAQTKILHGDAVHGLETLQRMDGNLDHVRENTHQTLQETQALNAKMEAQTKILHGDAVHGLETLQREIRELSSASHEKSVLVTLNYQMKDSEKKKLGKLVLYYTSDQAKTWQRYGSINVNHPTISFLAPREGYYGFYLQPISILGHPTLPPPGPGTLPHLWKLIDVTPPQVELRVPHADQVWRPGEVRVLRWTVRDAYLDPKSLRLSTSSDFGKTWKEVQPQGVEEAKDLSLQGRWAFRVPSLFADHTFLIRLSALDQAGNRGVSFSPPLSIDDSQMEVAITSATVTTSQQEGVQREARATADQYKNLITLQKQVLANQKEILKKTTEKGKESKNMKKDPEVSPSSPAREEHRRMENPPLLFSQAQNPQAQKLYEEGTTARAEGDEARAKEKFLAAVELDPAQADALNDLGYLYYHERRFPEAYHFLKEAYRVRPRDWTIFSNLALVAMEEKDWAGLYHTALEYTQHLSQSTEKSDQEEAWRTFKTIFETLREAGYAAWARDILRRFFLLPEGPWTKEATGLLKVGSG